MNSKRQMSHPLKHLYLRKSKNAMMLSFINPIVFSDFVAIVIGVLTFTVSVVTLLITLKMYEIADTALTTWRQEKRFDINIEGISQAFAANQLVHGFFNIDYNEFTLSSEQKKDIFKTKELLPKAVKYEIALKHYFTFKKDKYQEVQQMCMLAQKVISVSDNELLKTYYNKFLIYHVKNYSDIPQMLEQLLNNEITKVFGPSEAIETIISDEELNKHIAYYSPSNVSLLKSDFDQLYIKLTEEKL